jgi:hypothetical protein
VRRALKLFLTPGWVGVSLLLWGAAVAMVFLGRWQLDVSNSKHFDLQNFSYSFQWWAFSAGALLFWAKIVRDAVRGRTSAGAVATGELAVRSTGIAHVGPAELVTSADGSDAAPVVYRGYVIPQSATTPARSNDDSFHGSYNDYLWQLSLADAAKADRAVEDPGD